MFAWAGGELLVRRPATREARADWLHRFAARVLRGLEVEIEVEGSFPERGAVIANHLSYLDIPVFAALHPCVFVSKAEVLAWPVLGWMTKMAGTVYVARGRGGSAARAGGGMRAAAEAGLPVVFFPEGTTTNGSGLLKFHSGLLAQAMEQGEPVTAAYVRYTLGSDNDADVTVADDVCYWGDAKMLPHIFRLLGLRGLRVEVRFAERPIEFSSDVMHRKLAAMEARAAVAALGELPAEESRRYQKECTIFDSTNLHET
jgi:1-acyl-sn-glycerol-3-phosphate acyltransferase